MFDFVAMAEVELSAEDIAEQIATASASQQAEFLWELAKAFTRFADDKIGMQMVGIRQALPQDAKDFIAKLNKYVNE